jgi:hypothetical protein
MFTQHQSHGLLSIIPLGELRASPLQAFLLSFLVSSLVVYVYLSSLPYFGRFPTHHVPSVRRNLGYAGLCGTLS